MTMQELKDEIAQTKYFQRLSPEMQFDMLNSEFLQLILRIINKNMYFH